MKEVLVIFGIAFPFFVIVLVLVFLIAYPLAVFDCNKLEKNTGKQTEYHFWGGGCLIEIDGEKIPSDQWFKNTGN